MKLFCSDYQRIVEAGIKTGEYEFLNKLINGWLEKFPRDLESEYYHAKITLLQDYYDETLRSTTSILARDPEYLNVYELLSKVGNQDEKKTALSNIHAISGQTIDISLIYPWAVALRAVRSSIKKRDIENADKLLRNLLGSQQENLLVALEHCKLSSLKDDHYTFHHLSDIYRNRWPDCVQFLLINAKAKLLIGQELEAISLLHTCVALDPAGQVIQRLWGNAHEFNSLWPEDRFINIDFQIPSAIAVSLDWNQLPEGRSSRYYSSKKIDTQNPVDHDTVADSRKARISGAEKHQNQSHQAYVILTTRSGLEKKYGTKTAQFIIDKLEELKEIVDQKPDWDGIVYIPDDFHYIAQYGITPIDKIDPWKIKLSLNDLNSCLSGMSKRIGALIIIGGHEVVPFHNLPNPTDDSDKGVFSDNPYATNTGNYLLPEWSVGRLPDESGRDAGLLIEQIRQIYNFHKSALDKGNFLSNLFVTILDKIELRRILQGLLKKPKDFGYSTAVWRRSSLAAFRPVGKGSDLRITPPYDSDTIDIDNLMKSKCAFFNLHGLADTPEWYGQRDFSEAPSGPDFPVAISANNIPNMRNNIDMVFTEACYGGFVVDKNIENSMALKMVSIGCQGFVSSTCISYGSVFTPLIGSDLLAFVFWKYLKDGFSFGESLMQAKIGLIKVMNQRQGYLDGEDQKTLMSFVLYGDPLGFLESNIYLEKTEKSKVDQNLDFKTITDQEGVASTNPKLQMKLAKELREVVQSYIPSLNNADIKIREYKIKISKLIEMANQLQEQTHDAENFVTHTQIMYSQKTRVSRITHEKFARITMNENGKVIKFAVSR